VCSGYKGGSGSSPRRKHMQSKKRLGCRNMRDKSEHGLCPIVGHIAHRLNQNMGCPVHRVPNRRLYLRERCSHSSAGRHRHRCELLQEGRSILGYSSKERGRLWRCMRTSVRIRHVCLYVRCCIREKHTKQNTDEEKLTKQ